MVHSNLMAQANVTRSEATKRLKWQLKALEFLIQLSESDPAALVSSEQPGDLLNVCAGLARLVHPLPDGGEKVPHPGAFWMEQFRSHPALLTQLIKELAEFLLHVADDFQCSITPRPDTRFVITPEFRIESRHPIQSVAVVLGWLLVLVGPTFKPRRCNREACRRIFIPNRPKQTFCTRKCASAAAFERYKEKLGPEAYRASRVRKSLW